MSLKLLLELDRKKIASGSMPEAKLRLLNDGSEMCIANVRMLLAPVGTPDTLKEVEFIFLGPEGSVNLKKFHVNSGPPALDNFGRLFPGEYVFTTYELGKYFSYKQPGTYKISARYNNSIRVKLHDAYSWTGTLFSNEESFEITG